MTEFNSAALLTSTSYADGIKVVVFMEKDEGLNSTCLQNLLESTDLVTTDKHAYMYVAVGKKALDSSSFKNCSEITLSKTADISENGLHYPVFVSRLQEWKKFDVIWSFRAYLLSEGLEDEGNE